MPVGWRNLPMLLAFAAALPMLAAPVAAAPPTPVIVPADALAYYRLTPAPNAPRSGWLTHLMQTLHAAGAIPRNSHDATIAADGVLVGSLLSAYPHSVILLDLDAQRYIPRQVDIDQLRAVLIVEAPGEFDRFRQVLQTVLTHYGQPEDRLQEVIEFTGPTAPPVPQGARYRFRGWPDWLAIEWVADAHRFYVGVGTGALQRWFEGLGQKVPDDRVAVHRKLVEQNAPSKPGTVPAIEFFADLANLRKAIPTLFETGRTRPVLELFGLERADQIMLHGRWAGTFLQLDFTTRTGTRYEHTPLSLDHWPADAGVPQPPGRFHLAAPMTWPMTCQRLFRLVWLGYEPEDRPAHEAAVAHYINRTDIEPEIYVAGFRSYLLMSDHPAPWLPIPGALSAYFVALGEENLKTQAVDSRLLTMAQRQFEQLMHPLLRPLPEDGGSAEGDLELGVVYDAAADVYWLDCPLRRLFKAPAWGWAHYRGNPILVASYSPQAVLSNRQWLSRAPQTPAIDGR